jgi:hypothetical protein
MATGLTFWQMPEEQDRFLEHVAKADDTLAIRHFEALPDRSDLRVLPLAAFVGLHDFKRLHIFPAQFADDIVIPGAERSRFLCKADCHRAVSRAAHPRSCGKLEMPICYVTHAIA